MGVARRALGVLDRAGRRLFTGEVSSALAALLGSLQSNAPEPNPDFPGAIVHCSDFSCDNDESPASASTVFCWSGAFSSDYRLSDLMDVAPAFGMYSAKADRRSRV